MSILKQPRPAEPLPLYPALLALWAIATLAALTMH